MVCINDLSKEATRGMDDLDRVLLEGDQEAITASFQSALDKYPTNAFLCLSYTQWKLLSGDYEGLETVFAQYLKSLPSVKLWLTYLSYLRSSKLLSNETDEDRAQSNAVLAKAYESAILHVGLDVDSLPIWRDYIEFTKSQPASNFYEQQQVMDQTRRLYHRSLLMPIDGIETLWSSYDAYENALNKLTAKKMLSDRSPSYMLARSFCKELKDLVGACDRDALPGMTADGSAARLLPWMNWVAWERSNPLKIAEGPVLHARIAYAFKCAFAALRSYPEVAFEYSKYLCDKGLNKEAEAVLKQSCAASPLSLLVHFALADLQEASDESNTDETKVIYEGLISRLEAQTSSLPDTLSIEAQSLFSDLTLAYIQWMHHSRRSEGIPSARAVFTRARKNPHIGLQIFIAAARMEYHCKKDAVVAGKIFELGMARFGALPEYVMEYLNHLILLNDDTNTRALFERALQLVPSSSEGALELWKMYLDYEFHYGDSKSIGALERRFKAAYPEHPIARDISLFSRRFGFAELQPASDERVWTILQANPHPSPEGHVRQSKPKLAVNTDLMADLVLRLPPPHVYTGPVIEQEALVRLLQTCQDPNRHGMTVDHHHKEPARSSKRSTGGDDKKRTRERERDRARRDRSKDRHDRHRKETGRSSHRHSRSRSPPHTKHDDIFEQRFRQRESERK